MLKHIFSIFHAPTTCGYLCRQVGEEISAMRTASQLEHLAEKTNELCLTGR